MQRRPTKNTRGPNSDEKRYHQWIKESFICVACSSNEPVNCHHCKGATYKHNKELIGHLFCIGLCQNCDNLITNGSRRLFTDKFGPQNQLWLNSVGDYIIETGNRFDGFDNLADAIMDCGE